MAEDLHTPGFLIIVKPAAMRVSGKATNVYYRA